MLKVPRKNTDLPKVRTNSTIFQTASPITNNAGQTLQVQKKMPLRHSSAAINQFILIRSLKK